jgi:tetratricopeptide (TPR) repeat protein
MTRDKLLCSVIGLVLGATLSLFAQSQSGGQSGQTPTPPTGGGGNVPTTPTPTTPTRPTSPSQPSQIGQPQQRMGFPEMQRPIFLSGKVMLDDGTPPPDPVVIERVCNGVPRPEAYTDFKGHFSFQLGQNMNVMPDASVGSGSDPAFGGGNSTFSSIPGMSNSSQGISERDLMGCELRANVPGFRSDVITLAGRRFMDNPDVGIIILHRLGNVEGLTISATSLLAPKDARKAFEKGREALKKKKLADAQKQFQKAVKVYPKYASAWYQLGTVYEQQDNVPEARKAYASALEADPKFVSPYMQLAGLSAREQKWEDVAETTDRVLRLNAISFPRAYFFNSLANYQLHRFEPAEKSAIEAQKLDTDNRYPQIQHLLGLILAEKRDFKGAAEKLKAYLKLAPNTKEADLVRKQLSEVEKLAQATDVSQQQPQQ